MYLSVCVVHRCTRSTNSIYSFCARMQAHSQQHSMSVPAVNCPTARCAGMDIYVVGTFRFCVCVSTVRDRGAIPSADLCLGYHQHNVCADVRVFVCVHQ